MAMSENPCLESVRLTDGHVVVRAFAADEVEPLYAAIAASVADLRRWMPWCHAEYARDDARRFIEFARESGQRGDEYNFGVFRARDEALLGSCGLNRRDRVNRSANLGYWVRSDQTQRGVATAAARLVARFGFDALALERITILAAVDNEPSQRVARRVGACYEGLARRAVRVGDEQHDGCCYSLIRDDLRDAS